MNRKYFHGLLALALAVTLLVSACAPRAAEDAAASVASPTIAATPASTPSINQLLSGALSSLLAGNYEEAILAYTAIIEIEPKNFDAHLGLGKSYRAAKQPRNAVAALETARALRADDRDMLVELGHVYLDVGSYALAEGVARPLWESATPDMDAGVVLLLSLIAQDKINDARPLMWEEELAAYWGNMSEEDIIYFGQFNDAGERYGKGVGLYSEGFIYVGDYRNDLRSGEGSWYAAYGFDGDYYVGEWTNDVPNGYGVIHFANREYWMGAFADGLEHGSMRQYCSDCDDMHEYSSVHGRRQWISIKNIPKGYGENNEWGAYFQCHSAGYYIPCRSDQTYGIIPWANQQGRTR